MLEPSALAPLVTRIFVHAGSSRADRDKRAMIASSAQNILLADSSKFGLVKANHFADMDDIDLIITDSFHGCVFSILFERKFEVFNNDSGGNDRISSLLNLLEINNTSAVDYLQVKNTIDKLRKSATNYLFEKLQ